MSAKIGTDLDYEGWKVGKPIRRGLPFPFPPTKLAMDAALRPRSMARDQASEGVEDSLSQLQQLMAEFIPPDRLEDANECLRHVLESVQTDIGEDEPSSFRGKPSAGGKLAEDARTARVLAPSRRLAQRFGPNYSRVRSV